MGFYFAIAFAISNVITACIRVWYSNRYLTWIEEVGDDMCLLMYLCLLLYIARYLALGQAVMFARNGQRVLQMMTAAATNAGPKADVQMVLLTLPWLTAFDRRDTMTIKMVLDVRARLLIEERTAEQVLLLSVWLC